MAAISPTAQISDESVLEVGDLEVGEGAIVEPGVEIRGDRARIGEGARIGRDCRFDVVELSLGDGTEIGRECSFDAREVAIGSDTWIGRDCHFSAVRGTSEVIRIGDDAFIGPSTNVLMPIFHMGDYVKVHNHVLVNGYAGCYIGHNAGSADSLLNAVETLVLGNNVSLGIATCVFTHAFSGELLEGCQVMTTAPTTIEDNVWTAGPNHMIGPGVTIGRRTMVLPNAVISGDVPEGSCVGGGPPRSSPTRSGRSSI